MPQFKVGDRVQMTGSDTVYYVAVVHSGNDQTSYDLSMSQDGPIVEHNVPEGGMRPADG